MDRADIAFWLSIAGFATSSILAIIKGIEFFGSRRIVFTANARLTSSEDIGNEIVLLNKSSIPATISYFELVWFDQLKVLGWKIPFTSRVVKDGTPLDPPYGYDMSVAPHETHSLSFRHEYHFDWGKDLKHDIYLKLWLVGRTSPIWLWITGPGQYK
jgi:hypothetical protein